MGPFLFPFENVYILQVVNYVFKWVKALPTRTNEARVMVKFLSASIFSRYGMPCAIIRDQGTHFNIRSFDSLVCSCHYVFAHSFLTPHL